MVKDAEANAAEDKKRRELVEAQQPGRGLIHSTEKSLKELRRQGLGGRQDGDRDARSPRCKTALEGEDVEAIKAKTNDADAGLDEARRGDVRGAARRRAAAPASGAGAGGAEKDDVVDADFEEVDDDDKKKSA